ncbi:hypothetical protein AMS68_001944 [Peltaster fructicola]|uniref:Uncharacterized protein n=1 Tax=Peltaster fructicola TaxID=286661 RepID=A0A6H0XNU0_9PEZI|nr:hypothetical protein AMS68_001944 [Peltaster fructicola]
MTSVLALINRLLPFATPGTPIAQDVAHLAAICLLLYFAPQIQDWSRARVNSTTQVSIVPNGPEIVGGDIAEPGAHATNEDAEAEPYEEAPGPAVAPEPQANVHAAMVEDEADEDDDPMDGGNAAGPTDHNVGAKKAKSLARKDQRRAYNEFMRSQGEAQRARDAEGAAEREATLEAERKRRAQAEAELAAKKAKEREQKREAEQAERDAEYQRRETAVAIVKADLLANNISDLHKVARQVGGDVDEEWVEKVIHASGIVGKEERRS